jgi:flagellar biosynthesis protein
MEDYDTKVRQNKTKIAVALGYEKEIDLAPRVIASGSGPLAENIIRLAEESGVEVRENSDLAKILSILEVNSYIPLEVYAVVAEILAHIYKSKKNNS